MAYLEVISVTNGEEKSYGSYPSYKAEKVVIPSLRELYPEQTFVTKKVALG